MSKTVTGLLISLLASLFLTITCSAQRSAGETANIEPLYLIDMPVAGLLPATAGSIETYLYPEGGVLIGAVYGLRRNLNVGVFYGGTRLIGSGGITWDNFPGFLVRYRLFEENAQNPAVVAGIETQGKDGYIPSWHQYVVKSPGLFVTASKNYELWGNVSFHGGINYTLERHDHDWSPNIYFGMEKSVGELVSVLGEYNFAFDNDKDRIGFWNGSFSLAARVATNIGFNLDIQIKNLLTSAFYYQKIVRSIHIQYVRYL